MLALLILESGFLGCTNTITTIRGTIKLGIKLYDRGDLLFETHYWYAALKVDQTYLGSATIRLRRVEGTFGNITEAEILELRQIIGLMEHTAKKRFGASHLNWSCLMNHAYRLNPPIPLIHIHFHPRYIQKKVIFAGLEFFDDNPAAHYKAYTYRVVPPIIKKEIIRAYKEEFRNFAIVTDHQ